MKYVSQIFNYLRTIPIWIILPLLLLAGNCLAGFNGLYGQDSFEYLRYSRAIHSFFSEGSLPGPFHWPVFYPLTGALFSFILPDIFSLQALSIACYGLTIFFMMKILTYLAPERQKESSLFLMLFLALSPFVLLYSSVVMSDSMALCMIAAFFYCFTRYSKENKNVHFLALILLSFILINIRLAALIILVVPVIISLIQFFRNFNIKTFVLLLLLIIAVFIPFVIILNKWNHQFYRQLMTPDWSLKYLFQSSFITENGIFNYRLPNISLVLINLLHPGFIFAGLFFILFSGKKLVKGSPFLIPGITAIIYALFIACLPTQNYRFLLLSFPIIILIYSSSFFAVADIIRNNVKPVLRYILVGVIVLAQLTIAQHVFTPFYRNSKVTKEIASHMKKFPSRTIYTFNIDMVLKAYGIENKTINLWESRIRKFEPQSLVLFNYEDTYKQWKGTNPMLNWESLQQEYQLKLIDKLPGNWNLYEIEN